LLSGAPVSGGMSLAGDGWVCGWLYVCSSVMRLTSWAVCGWLAMWLACPLADGCVGAWLGVKWSAG